MVECNSDDYIQSVNKRTNNAGGCSRMRKCTFIMVAAVLIISLAITACVKEAAPAATTPAVNQPPVLWSLTAAQTQTYPGGSVNLQAVVSDPNGDLLNYNWTTTGGSFVESGRDHNTWVAPNHLGNYDIELMVDDGKGGTVDALVTISVSANHPPVISSLTADPSALSFASRTILTVIASDPDGDTLQYIWDDGDAGTISGIGDKVSWTSPSKNRNYNISVTVSDGNGTVTRQEIVIPVTDTSSTQAIPLVK